MYESARKLNVYDDQYVKFIKQHNWSYGDAAILPQEDRAKGRSTEKREAYSYKGQAEINRLSPMRIKDMTGVHFEYGNQKMAM